MFKKLKDKKGFTLVELIVVLVILAILAALLIPALTGYIDKANKEKIVSETRMVVMAVQTEASEAYGKAGAGKNLTGANGTTTSWDADSAEVTEIKTLSEVLTKSGVSFEATVTPNATVTKVSYKDANYTCTYENGTYTTTDNKGNTTALTNVVTIAVAGSNAGGNTGNGGQGGNTGDNTQGG